MAAPLGRNGSFGQATSGELELVLVAVEQCPAAADPGRIVAFLAA
jgi:hypothetical protein